MFNLTLPGKSIISPKTPALPPEAPPLPTPEDPSVKARATDVANAAKRRAGLAGTVKTSGLGDTSAATVTRKTLGE